MGSSSNIEEYYKEEKNCKFEISLIVQIMRSPEVNKEQIEGVLKGISLMYIYCPNSFKEEISLILYMALQKYFLIEKIYHCKGCKREGIYHTRTCNECARNYPDLHDKFLR